MPDSDLDSEEYMYFFLLIKFSIDDIIGLKLEFTTSSSLGTILIPKYVKVFTGLKWQTRPGGLDISFEFRSTMDNLELLTMY